jgi:hypothetical protein
MDAWAAFQESYNILNTYSRVLILDAVHNYQPAGLPEFALQTLHVKEHNGLRTIWVTHRLRCAILSVGV